VDTVMWVLGGVTASVGAALLVVPKELWRRWSIRLVDRIDQGVLGRVTRFDARYREFIFTSLRFVDLKGLATVGFYTPELDDVYVDVSLAHRAPHEVPTDVLGTYPDDVVERHSIMSILDNEQAVLLAVIGAPGSGKTTLLRHAARKISQRPRDARRRTPVLLYLRDHVESIVADKQVTLPTLIRQRLGSLAEGEPPGWFEQRLSDGDCVVLLDGLDEVSRQSHRRTVADWVEHLTRQYPKNDFVVTSRPHGYRSASIDGAVVMQVRSFTAQQVEKFVRSWYRSVDEQTLTNYSSANDLLRRLNRAPRLYELTVNPLLLTMIANVHRYRGALPGSRADLYAEISQVMLWRRQEAKNLAGDIDGDKKEILLRSLAFAMMRKQVRDLPRADAVDELASAMRRASVRGTAEELLDEICSFGLLVERESGQYAFSHLTFQESLAATHVRAKGLVNILTENVDNSWWRETTLLYAIQSDADQIVSACLASGSVAAMSLAFDCAEESGDLAPELRDRLSTASESDAVRVTRHLRETVRSDHGGLVCSRLITTEIYRRFLAGTGHPRPDSALVDGPVTGVRASDAAAFVGWVNRVLGESSSYRLPTAAEISDNTVRRTLSTPLHPWLEGGRLWTPAGAAHPNVVTPEAMHRALDTDFARLAPILARLVLQKIIPAVRRQLDMPVRGSLSSGKSRFVYLSDAEVAELRQYVDGDIAGKRGLTRRLDIAVGLGGSGMEALDPRRIEISNQLMLGHGVDRDFTPELNLLRRIATAVHSANRADDEYIRRQMALGADPGPDGVGERLSLEINRSKLDAVSGARRLPDDVPEFEVRPTALSRGLSRTVSSQQSGPWLSEFKSGFTSVAKIGDVDQIVSLDALASKMRDCRRSLSELESDAWVSELAETMARIALPVFNREVDLTPDNATSIRISALCLTAVADPAASNDLQNLAAGITLLEQRTRDSAAASETIVLATD
jgi:energy-coupling factor transporter ATP-binding protein EcfA2